MDRKKKIPTQLKDAKCPFLNDLEIDVVYRPYREVRIDPSKIKMDDGVIVDVGKADHITKYAVVEKDSKVTLYTTYKGESLAGYYKLLSKQGRILLDYILLYAIREDKLLFYLDATEFMEEFNVASRTTVMTAKQNLITSLFIVPTAVQNWFWINPKFIFMGSRTRSVELTEALNRIKKPE